MARVDYQARILPGSGYVEKTRPTELSLALSAGGALVAPSGGEVSIYNAAGNAVVDAVGVTVTGSRAVYVTSASSFTNESLGMGGLAHRVVAQHARWLFARRAPGREPDACPAPGPYLARRLDCAAQ